MNGPGRFLLIAVACVLLTAGCAGEPSGSSGAPSSSGKPVAGTWIDVDVAGDSVTIPLATIEQYVDTHFSIDVQGERLDYMAYLLDDALHVRANVCPPCRSRGFTLDGAVLVCDMCATTFDARDGSGIEGACVDYPKASAPYEVVDGAVVIEVDDLVEAFEQTIARG